ncbi:hypothetical protein Q1695_004440 [Nippostrongylus brasiliensis]|nr:hypothetical protein Q1695_004440 [Nippostrongylus brasiliensis]
MRTRSAVSVKGAKADEPSELLGGAKSDDWIAAIDEVTRSSTVPKCVKKAIDLLARQLSCLLEQKDKEIGELRAENDNLRSIIASLESESVKRSSDPEVSQAHVTTVGSEVPHSIETTNIHLLLFPSINRARAPSQNHRNVQFAAVFLRCHCHQFGVPPGATIDYPITRRLEALRKERPRFYYDRSLPVHVERSFLSPFTDRSKTHPRIKPEDDPLHRDGGGVWLAAIFAPQAGLTKAAVAGKEENEEAKDNRDEREEDKEEQKMERRRRNGKRSENVKNDEQ